MNYKGTIIRAAGYLKGRRAAFALSFVMAAISVAATILSPFYAGRAIDCLAAPGSVDTAGLVANLALMAAAAAAGLVSQYGLSRLNNTLAYTVSRNMRDEAFDKLNSLPFSYIDTHRQGDVVSRVMGDVDQVAEGLLLGFSQFFTSVLTILSTLCCLLLVDWRLALLVLALSPLSFLVAAFIASRTHRFFRLTAEKRALQTDQTDEIVSSGAEIISYDLAGHFKEEFASVNRDWADSSLKGTFFSSLVNPSTRAVNSIVYAAVALAGGLLAITGRISVGSMVSALSYAKEYTKPFNEITGVVTELQNALVCAARVFSLIDEESADDSGERSLPGGALSVEFEHVRFSYDPEKKLIEDFSLSVAPGKHVAIVGPTGAGKSTVINLLLRYYDTLAGDILIDRTPIRALSLESLRKSFGTVLQDTFLITGTVHDNIDMGRGLSRLQVEDAARRAHVHSIIMRLEEGYDTPLDDSTAKLSAGERQLLGIARCMAGLPDLLILDEATSSIDTRTERLIQDAFNTMMEGRTSFVVAHRLSTIRDADVILVMRDGKIVETGTHGELLAKGGFYRELHDSQFALPED